MHFYIENTAEADALASTRHEFTGTSQRQLETCDSNDPYLPTMRTGRVSPEERFRIPNR